MKIDLNKYQPYLVVIEILDLDINYQNENFKKGKVPFHKRIERCEYWGNKILLTNKAHHERSFKHRDGRYLMADRFIYLFSTLNICD
jgi:hypothetical protein